MDLVAAGQILSFKKSSNHDRDQGFCYEEGLDATKGWTILKTVLKQKALRRILSFAADREINYSDFWQSRE